MQKPRLVDRTDPSTDVTHSEKAHENAVMWLSSEEKIETI